METRPHKGVFWLIDGAIWAVPFDDKKYECGISKSGDSYVHKKIWKAIKPKKCRYSYNYYPRGRVERRISIPPLQVRRALSGG